MGKSNKQSSSELSNCLMLHHSIISLEVIQQMQGKCYSASEIYQSDCQTIN